MADEEQKKTKAKGPSDESGDALSSEADETPGADGTDETTAGGGPDVAVVSSGTRTPAVDEERPALSDLEVRLSRRELNRVVLGQLILHYPERDVSVVVDGDSALRILGVYAGQVPPQLLDRINVSQASAQNLWVGLDLERALAMSWIPGLGERATRAVVDPPVPAGLDTAAAR